MSSCIKIRRLNPPTSRIVGRYDGVELSGSHQPDSLKSVYNKSMEVLQDESLEAVCVQADGRYKVWCCMHLVYNKRGPHDVVLALLARYFANNLLPCIDAEYRTDKRELRVTFWVDPQGDLRTARSSWKKFLDSLFDRP